MSFAKRIYEIRIHLFGNRGQKHFANYLGIPQSSLGKYEKGVSPNIQTIERILKKTGCNPNWLLLGEGRMFENRYKKFGKTDVPENGLKYFGIFSSNNFAWDPESASDKSVQIPNFYSDMFFAMSFKGDVLEPEIKGGDICVFEYSMQNKAKQDADVTLNNQSEDILKNEFLPYNKKIVIYTYDGMSEVRSLHVDMQKKLLYFVPFNNKYQPSVFTINEKNEFSLGNTIINSLAIQGFMVTVIRNYSSNI